MRRGFSSSRAANLFQEQRQIENPPVLTRPKRPSPCVSVFLSASDCLFGTAAANRAPANSVLGQQDQGRNVRSSASSAYPEKISVDTEDESFFHWKAFSNLERQCGPPPFPKFLCAPRLVRSSLSQ